eukprot:scaffold297552_cov30-Tisochrysis_lutea.AAC.3
MLAIRIRSGFEPLVTPLEQSDMKVFSISVRNACDHRAKGVQGWRVDSTCCTKWPSHICWVQASAPTSASGVRSSIVAQHSSSCSDATRRPTTATAAEPAASS